MAHPVCEMDGDAGELGAASLDFTGMEPDANIEADLTRRVADRGPAADRALGTVEGGEHAIAGELPLLTREPLQLTTDDIVVAVELDSSELSPGDVATAINGYRAVFDHLVATHAAAEAEET